MQKFALRSSLALGAAFFVTPLAVAQETSTAIETVTVTAQKRPERLQDAPVAVSVLSASQLSENNATNISDLNNLVPSVQLNGTFNGRVPFAMRGISTNTNEQTVGVASGVALMLDGVPIPSDSYAANQLQDVQQIEVLKGPQATLGGRTAAAGEINIVTRGPSDTFTGSFSGTVTDRSGESVNGFVAGPLSDNLQFSVSAFQDHTIYPIHNNENGEDSDQNSYGLRAKLRIIGGEHFDATLTGRFAHSDSDGANLIYVYTTPGATLLFPGSPLTTDLFLPGIHAHYGNLDYNSPIHNSGMRVKDGDVSLEMNYRFGDGYTLTSTTAYLNETQHLVQDLFATAAVPVVGIPSPPNSCGPEPQLFFQFLTLCNAPYFGDTQIIDQTARQTSEEIKLVSPAGRSFTWLVGLFYSDTVIDEKYVREFVGAPINIRVKPDTATYDIYGRATWNFAENWSLIAGLRYNYDDLSYDYNQIEYAVDNVPQGPHQSSGTDTSSTFVGDVSLQYRLSPDSMIYGTYARGYSPRVYNTALALTESGPDILTPAEKESIDHFELGSKGIYADGRLGLNIAVFHTQYDDYQIQTFSQGVVFPQLILVNGAARTQGAELDAIFAATDHLQLTFNVAYIDAEFTDYKNAPCYPNSEGTCIGTFDATGKPMPNSPHWKFNIGAEHEYVFDAFDMTLRGNYAYRSEAQMLADQNPHAVQKAFGILNLSATFSTKSGNYSLTAFVNNVFDHVYYVDIEDFWGAPWAGNNMVIGQPARDAKRYVGLRLNADF